MALTLLTLAVKNVRHQARSYAAFFLSSAFAVWLFFLYGSLLFHPDLTPDLVPEPVPMLMLAMEFIVAGFSVLFILYAHSAFLKTRRRELALLTTLGMLPRQIAGIIFRENGLVGLGAIAGGVGFGLVFARLFFLGIGKVLGIPHPLPFYLSWEAVLLTCVGFGLLFSVISGLSVWTLRRLSIADTFREAARVKAPPRFSVWLAGLGLLTLGAFYWMGLIVAPRFGEIYGELMLLLGLIGTYLLFTQGGVLAVRALQRRRSLYWRETWLVTISQLAIKLKENARILFMVSVLSSIVISLVTLLYAGWTHAGETAVSNVPIGLMVVDRPGLPGPEQVEAVLRKHGVKWTASAELPAVLATLERTDPKANRPFENGLAVVPAGAYRQWLSRLTDVEPPAVPDGQAVLVTLYVTGWAPEPVRILFPDGPVDRTAVLPAGSRPEGRTVTLPLAETRVAATINGTRWAHLLAVVDDTTFARLESMYGQGRTTVLRGWSLPDWQRSGAAVDELQAAVAAAAPDLAATPGLGPLTASIQPFREFKQTGGFLLFLLSFVSILFFLASGNMLYFKLFTDLQEDRRQFQTLYKLGLGPPDVRRIVSVQTGVLFFAPLAVAGAHSALLVGMVGQAVDEVFWGPMGLVTVTYLLLHGIYFLVTRRTYVSAVLS